MRTFGNINHHVPLQGNRRKHGSMNVAHMGKAEAEEADGFRTLSCDSCYLLIVSCFKWFCYKSSLAKMDEFIKQELCIILYRGRAYLAHVCIYATTLMKVHYLQLVIMQQCSNYQFPLCSFVTRLRPGPTHPPSRSPPSSSLFHSFSFLLSQSNVIQDWCWKPQLWHCNLCSALVARQHVWDRNWWCTSLTVCLLKGKRMGGGGCQGGYPAISQRLDDASEFLHFENERLGICSAAENTSHMGHWRG